MRSVGLGVIRPRQYAIPAARVNACALPNAWASQARLLCPAPSRDQRRRAILLDLSRILPATMKPMSREIGDIPTRIFKLGDVIFREGDDAKGEAFIVHSGKVEIRQLVAGEEQLLNVLKEGELLGGFALFRNAPRSATAIAAEPVTLMVIPANRLDHMVRSNPTLAVALIRDLLNRLFAAEGRAREAETRAHKPA